MTEDMRQRAGLPKNVRALGVVSLFMDMSSEMIYPLMPLFLSTVLHASKISIGLIEGVAESTASLVKVFSGIMSDRLGKRKSIIFWGYGVSVFSRPILALASSWPMVLGYRFTDRFGKGVRTPPRDAIIADSTDTRILGKAFGFHRAMDTIGAVIGPAIASLILVLYPERLRWVFWISIIPGMLALLSIAVFVTDPKGPEKQGPIRIFDLRGLNHDFKVFLTIVTIFTLGKTSEAFLVLRARDAGVSIAMIPLMYLCFNLVSAACAMPAGMIADRLGKKRTIIAGYLVCAAVFVGFAGATRPIHAWMLFLGYGIFVALNDGVQRAYVATLVRPDATATGYGIYHGVVGLAALPSGIIGGMLWQYSGASTLFYYGAGMSLLASLLFIGAHACPRKGVAPSPGKAV
jgi:MFS family permease